MYTFVTLVNNPLGYRSDKINKHSNKERVSDNFKVHVCLSVRCKQY